MMKIENITVNSAISFTGYTSNDVIHGILCEGLLDHSLNRHFIPGFEVSFYQMRRESQVALHEGVYLTVSYSVDSEDHEHLEFLLQNFFAGFVKPIGQDQIQGILGILRRFQNKRKDVTGLIGELIFILSSLSKGDAVQAWHISKDSIFDFNFKTGIYEVKCTSSLLRKHKLNHFQHKALTEIKEATYYVSLILNRNFPTNTIMDLVSRIEVHLSAEHKVLFSKKLDAYNDILSSQMKFDIDSTLNSLKIYETRHFQGLISHKDVIEAKDISFSLNFNRIEQ